MLIIRIVIWVWRFVYEPGVCYVIYKIFKIFPEFPLSSSDLCHDDHVRHQNRWSGGRHSGHSSGWRLHPASDCCPCHMGPASSNTGPALCPHQDGRHDGSLPAGGAPGPRGEMFSSSVLWSEVWWGGAADRCMQMFYKWQDSTTKLLSHNSNQTWIMFLDPDECRSTEKKQSQVVFSSKVL